MGSPATEPATGDRVPVVVACALVERAGRLLVAQRPPQKAQGGKWEFPGGKVEPGEAPAAALVRELHEELGITVRPGRELPRVTHDYGRSVITLVPFCCTLLEGEPHAHEHVAVRWCRPEEIASLDLAAADVPVLAAYHAAR